MIQDIASFIAMLLFLSVVVFITSFATPIPV